MTDREYFETVTLPQMMTALPFEGSYGVCWETLRKFGLENPNDAINWATEISAKISLCTGVRYKSDGIYFVK